MMSDEKELDRVRSIIADVLELEPSDVAPDANFILDLGGDSLRVIEILTRVEQELDISIDQSYLARMVSLDAVCEVINDCRGELAQEQG